MAKAKNIILHGVSGKIGDTLVIRQRGGMTILSEAPGEREKAPTESQKAHQAKFQQAVIYGKTVMADAESKAEYGEKADDRHSAYNVAVADFFHAPDIDEIDVTNYTGAIGDSIRIRATDDFKVVQLHVAIFNADGSLVEEGDAVQQENVLDWLYSATIANESLEGDKIVVKAADKPGNIAEQEAQL